MDVTYEVQGLEQMLTKMERATAPETLRPALEHAQEVLLSKLREYPDEPAESTYTRTGDLGRGWAMEGVVGLSATLSNHVPYAPYVQHDPSFPAPHQVIWNVHWKTDQQLMDEVSGEVGQDFTAAIQHVFDH